MSFHKYYNVTGIEILPTIEQKDREPSHRGVHLNNNQQLNASHADYDISCNNHILCVRTPNVCVQ